MTNPEEWRDVPGYEGWYQVSDQGRVKRIKGGAGARAERILTPIPARHDYLRIGLNKNGVRKHFSVHSLVAHAFIGERPEGLQVNHKNGDINDNRPCNLEYVTCFENMRHRINTLGTFMGGENNGRSKLTEADVLRIRELVAQGYSQRKLAKEYGINRRTLQKIVYRDLWRHV